MYIVCLTVKMKKENILPDEYEYHSDWAVFETLKEAEVVYNNLLNRKNMYTATICKPIESTEAHYLKETK